MGADEDKIEPMDSKIKTTIQAIIQDFYEYYHAAAVLLFHCDSGDDKQAKRNACFKRWFGDGQFRELYLREEAVIAVYDKTGNSYSNIPLKNIYATLK